MKETKFYANFFQKKQNKDFQTDSEGKAEIMER